MTFHKTCQTNIRTVRALAIAAACITLAGAPSFAFSPDAQQMCTGDALRLCGSEIPNIARITACMHRQKAKVSPGCRAVMDRDAGATRRTTRTAAD